MGKEAGKSAKAKKDPNAPKRGLSAYMFYGSDRRPSLKKEQPNLSFGDVTKTIAEEWKNLSAAEKKKYEDKAAADKVRYQKELAEYEKSGKKAAFDKSNPKSPKKAAPKRKSKKAESEEEESDSE